MKKIQDEKVQPKFEEIEYELRTHFIKQLLLAGTILILGIVIGVFVKSVYLTLYMSMFSIIYVMFVYFRILMCYNGKIVTLEGTVVEIRNRKQKGFNERLNRPYIMVIQDNGTYVKIFNSNTCASKEGNVIKAYAPYSSIKTINEDTVSVDNIYYILVSKTNKMQKEKN